MLVHLGLGPSLALARILQAVWRALYEGLHAVRNIYESYAVLCAHFYDRSSAYPSANLLTALFDPR